MFDGDAVASSRNFNDAMVRNRRFTILISDRMEYLDIIRFIVLFYICYKERNGVNYEKFIQEKRDDRQNCRCVYDDIDTYGMRRAATAGAV